MFFARQVLKPFGTRAAIYLDLGFRSKMHLFMLLILTSLIYMLEGFFMLSSSIYVH